jgi:hypothetical protein
MSSERLEVHRLEEGEWRECASLDVLPRMRALDLMRLVAGIAQRGDRVRYEGQWFSYQNGFLKNIQPEKNDG